MNQNGMQDQAILEDVLSSEKAMTGAYSTFTNECSTPQIRNEFLNLLNEEHQMQADVFDEMKKRGWYPTQNAQQNKIDQARQKYQNQKPQA
ncbi:MAG: spore coat protein [Oscillospiraceae bacterium]|nr:spore coat protein [Oscillospiraceae bacterium]